MLPYWAFTHGNKAKEKTKETPIKTACYPQRNQTKSSWRKAVLTSSSADWLGRETVVEHCNGWLPQTEDTRMKGLKVMFPVNFIVPFV